jgi:hypothetical protein
VTPPAAGNLSRADDPLAWHELAPLAAGSMRRLRRLDVSPLQSELVEVNAYFRDTYAEKVNTEVSIHEYRARVVADRVTHVIVEARVEPLALPWVECSDAALSAGRLCGQRLEEVTRFVRSDLSGNTTCTHLNDMFASIADACVLIELL